MRNLLFAVVAAVALSIVVAIHLYIHARLVVAPGWPAGVTTLGTAVMFALGACIPLSFVGERLVRPPLSRALVWPGAIWMGLAWFLLVLLGISDLVMALGGALGDPVGGQQLRAAAVLGGAAVLAAIGLRGALRDPRIARVSVQLDQLPDELLGFRIVQISDLHVGPILGHRWAERLVERIHALEPDLIVVTGDLIDGPVAHVADQVAPLGRLRAPHGVFYVTGNHEMYSGPARWVDHVRDGLGWRVLANEHVILEHDGARLALAGTHDRTGGMHGHAEDLDAALGGVPDGVPTLLLAHDPGTFRAASSRRVDLQLSGHTHGGQMWPFALLVRLAVPWVAGLHARDGRQLYVSRGTGFWGPPMRLLAPSEITEITLS